ncbi:YibE/F family protein [Lactobacillus sp. S2-2]|uniref:YibE/F family protein n=1 Tax=Lactobacillus sp. S2-2 TaxID=2692917 RepID=UPI001F42384A|nr:YibE/F family protein [Lactobacillus sp. S2-2]MCF6515616.1 YibE/F family protein [Lactobacillus sp. S2-2]
MSTITVLAIILLAAMILAGGVKGIYAYLGLILNFIFVFATGHLISIGLSAFWVTIVNSIIILLITIYFSNDQGQHADISFIGSIIVVLIVIALIIPILHWAQVQGFSNENNDDLEGMSLLIGIKFLNISTSMIILSCLGAVAEASVAISTGLTEIIEHNSKISNQHLIDSGLHIGKEIVGTAFNTLFFGLYGEILALLIWFERLHYSFASIINNKIFVSELIMTLISAIGVILTIPVIIGIILHRRKKEVL